MGRNENDVQREQKNVPICALEGDVYMHTLGGQHCKGYRLSGFHSTAKKQGKHTTGILLAKKPWNLTAGTWKCFILISKRQQQQLTRLAELLPVIFLTKNDEHSWLRLQERTDKCMKSDPTSTTDSQNNLSQLALTSLCI